MSPALEEYMKIAVWKKWDTTEIGTKLEAFAVAGCDVVSEWKPDIIVEKATDLTMTPSDLLRTSKQKANHLKQEIREMISEMLGMPLTL